MQFQNYTTLYQHLWQQHKMHLQKLCRAYLILLLNDGEYGIWTTGAIGRHCEKSSRRRKKPAAGREEEEEAKERQQDDDAERYDRVKKIKLVYEGKT